MTRWTDFVKDYASDHKISYGCALSKKECSEAYRKEKWLGAYDMKEDRFKIADKIRKTEAKLGIKRVSQFR
jgi:hypothetical protein